MLYSDGHVRECEKQFLRELRREAKEITPEFEALCEEAFRAPATNWSEAGNNRDHSPCSRDRSPATGCGT